MAAETLTLATMMGTYPKTTPLKQGTITSPMLKLDFADVEVAQKAFKDVVRHLKFDVAEIAIVSFLQAFDAGKPFVLLPFVMNGGFHHKSILVRDDSALRPQDLHGRSVAMRSYSQTTPTWVRGILMHEYGVRLEEVRWLSQEGAHVENYQDPPWVTQFSSKASLEDMLRAGEVAAILAGGGLSGNPGIRSLIPQPAEAALAWHERTRAIPINHMVSIRRELAEAHPDVVREIYRMLQEARATSGQKSTDSGPDLQPVGFEKIGPSLKMAAQYAHEQRLVRKRYSVEELYGNVAGSSVRSMSCEQGATMPSLISEMAYVRLSVPDLDRMEAFLTDFGMVKVHRDGQRMYMRGIGDAPFLRHRHRARPARRRELRLPAAGSVAPGGGREAAWRDRHRDARRTRRRPARARP